MAGRRLAFTATLLGAAWLLWGATATRAQDVAYRRLTDQPPAAPAPPPAQLDASAHPDCRCPAAAAHARAGGPQRVAPWAVYGCPCHYGGYYVGGSATSLRGAARDVDEGTWGWDYVGAWFHRGVWQNWWHGRRTQGGSGAYRTDR